MVLKLVGLISVASMAIPMALIKKTFHGKAKNPFNLAFNSTDKE
jgi:hypothetical protein